MDFVGTINMIATPVAVLLFVAIVLFGVWSTFRGAGYFKKIAAARGWSATGAFGISAERPGLRMVYGRTPRKNASSYHYFSAESASGFSLLGIYSKSPQDGSRKFDIRCDGSIKGKITSLMESDHDAEYFTSKDLGIELSLGQFDLLRGSDFKLSIPTGNRKMELRLVPPFLGAGGLPEMKDGQENEYGEMVEHGFNLLEKIAKIAREGGA